MRRDIEITPAKAPCDSHYHAAVGYKHMASSRKAEAKKWFQTADVKALSYQSLFNDAVLSGYNEGTKVEGNPISDAPDRSGAHRDNVVVENMEQRSMPFMHELGVLVEIRMKCLIYAEGKKPWGHKLPKLWSEIGGDTRREMELHYANQIKRHEGQMPSAMSAGNIIDDIKEIGDDFIDWRYETKPDMDTYLQFIKLGFINHVLEYAMLKYRQD